MSNQRREWKTCDIPRDRESFLVLRVPVNAKTEMSEHHRSPILVFFVALHRFLLISIWLPNLCVLFSIVNMFQLSF